jgi:hypothetical protein
MSISVPRFIERFSISSRRKDQTDAIISGLSSKSQMVPQAEIVIALLPEATAWGLIQ